MSIQRLCALWIIAVASLSAVTPVAIGAIGVNELVVLDEDGRLIFLDVASGTARPVRFTVNGTAVDFAAGGTAEQPLLLLSVRGAAHSFVGQLDRTGRILRNSMLTDGAPSGVAVDANTSTAYVSSLVAVSIHTWDLRQPGGPRYLLGVRGASRLSAMALDGTRQRLYVADPFDGTIYAIALDNRTQTKLALDLGSISALALSRDGKTLYVAETDHHRVVALDTTNAQPRPVVFCKVQQPSGVVVDASGRVWVTELRDATVTGYTAAGRVSTVFRLNSLVR